MTSIFMAYDYKNTGFCLYIFDFFKSRYVCINSFSPISTTGKNTFAKKIGFRVSSIWHVRGIYLRMGIFVFGNSQIESIFFLFLSKRVFFGLCIDKNLRLQSRPLRQTYKQIHYYSSKSFFLLRNTYM